MNAPSTARYETVQAFDAQLDSGGEKTPCIIVSLRVVDGPSAGVNHIWRGYLSPAAAPYTMKSLRAMGWTGTKVSKAMAEGLGTLKARAMFKSKIWEGKPREEISIFAMTDRAPKLADNPLEPGDIDAFDALFEQAAECTEIPAVPADAKAGPLPPSVKRAALPANPNATDF
jgi:hypothetical protein